MTATAHSGFARPGRRLWLWIVWGALILFFSYKRKILGEAGIRPWYLPGVAIGCVVMAWLLVKYPRLHHPGWRLRLEPGIAGLLCALIGYIVVQAAWHPESVRPMLYTTATVFLLFALAVLTICITGWRDFMLAITRLLLGYGALNVVLMAVDWVWPDRLSFLLVPRDESGFGTRSSGLPGDPTHLGSFLAVAVLLWFVLRRGLSRWWLLVVPVLFAAMIATGTRNALLSLLVGGAVATLVGRRGSAVRFVRLSVLLAAAGVLALWGLSFSSYGISFLAEIFRVADENAYSRLSVWRHMSGLAAEVPFWQQVFGGGYLYIQDVFGSPYNAFLRLYFNHGIAFTAGFLLAIAAVAWIGLKDRDALRRQTTFALLGYWFSFSMFLDTAFAEFFHITELCFWLAAALTVTHTIHVRNFPSAHDLGN